MSFQTKLSLAFVGLLLAAAVSTAISVYAIRESRHMIARMEIAHGLFQRYLDIAIGVGELSRVRSELALTGVSDGADAEIRAQLLDDLLIVRALTVRGIDVGGTGRIGDLNRLAAIEWEVRGTLRSLEEMPVLPPGRPYPESDYVARIVGGYGYDRLSTLIDMTIDEGRAELEQLEHETTERLAQLNVTAVGGLMVAVAMAFGGLILLRRDLQRPLSRLVAGADALGSGQLAHRIPADGPAEFNRLGGALNLMAERVLQRTKELSEARDTLEDKVRARNAELQAALEQLGEADTNRRRLLADVSHELRTPLSIVRGEADVALRSQNYDRDDFVEAVSRMRDAAIHSAQIVDDLLFVARSEEGTVRLNLRQTDLVDILISSVETAQGLARGTTSTIRFVPEMDEAPVEADPQRLRQVALILMDNAVRYGGDQIVVRAMRRPEGMAFSVSDNGTGMSEDEMANAFGRFFRGHNAAASYGAGTGLGLPVAKAIIDAHGGSIALKSGAEDVPSGRGLSIIVTLPAS